MDEKFLKARIPAALYDQLLARAGTEGKRLGTYVREVLQRDAQAIGTGEALARIEAALQAAPPAPAVIAPVQSGVVDHEARQMLQEVRLLARELAMQHNAQILGRVAAQLAAQTAQPNADRRFA